VKTFDGRVAVITGGAGGIGLAMAKRFARAGMKIVIADVESKALAAAARELKVHDAEVLAVRTDVTNASSVEALAKRAYARFGAVHVLCNNAGVFPPDRYSPIWAAALDDWKWAIDVNIMGVAHGMHAFIPRMLKGRQEGHVVNTASIAGLISGAGSPIYGMTKHAVTRISEAMYASLAELRSKIGASVLCPGLVATGIFKSERNRPGPKRGKGVAPPAKYRHIPARTAAHAMDPAVVAEQVFQAIRANRFYVVTTPSFDDVIRSRHTAIQRRRNPVFLDQGVAVSRDSRRASR
jgi:NAD(P)-dependent dehydrogenase (short-subunit alcohol dehydrogenase family)